MDNGRQAEGVAVMHRRYAGGLVEIRRPYAWYRGGVQGVETVDGVVTILLSWFAKAVWAAERQAWEWQPQTEARYPLNMFPMLRVDGSGRVVSIMSPFAGHYRITLFLSGSGFDDEGDTFGNL